MCHKKKSFQLGILVLLCGTTGVAAGVEVSGVLSSGTQKIDQPPRYLAKSNPLEPIATLARAEAAALAEVEAIALWNSTGQQPRKMGFVRSLPVAMKLQLDLERVEKSLRGTAVGSGQLRMNSESDLIERTHLQQVGSKLVWAARLEVEGAWGLRMRLADARLPAAAEMWVYDDQDRYSFFGPELLRPDGDLWTPAVAGEVLNLEIHVPRESFDAGGEMSFEIDQVAQHFRLDDSGAPVLDDGGYGKSCTQSAACWTSEDPAFDTMKRATAYMEIVKGSGVFLCSGTLMNSTVGDFAPYFLTAYQCLGNQNDATSTTFYFDYIPSLCGGFDPSLFSLPRVFGAALLAKRPALGSSFLELFAQPSGLRGYAGWTTTPPTVGEGLNSLSHPNGRSMRYSRTSILATGGCGLNLDDYVFSDQEVGGVQGGSTGSSAFNDSYQVVGQLRGACGADPSDGCFWSQNDRVDGRFSRFFPLIEPWLSPSSPRCIPTFTTMCLNDDRFEVKATYSTPAGDTGNGQGVELTEDTGYFWFFSENNVEVVIKVLEACGLNDKFWVFAGGLTNVGVSLTVRDTVTGNSWAGGNVLGRDFVTITDTSALSCS